MGSGPLLLLLHGTGAATHSWRDLAPMLAKSFRLVAPDLPGHGFTGTPKGDGLSLPGMAGGLAALLARLEMEPVLAVGHSAGAAVAMRMAGGGRFAGGVVSLNGALRPFPGAAGHIFPAMAKLLFLNPLAPQAFAWRAAQPGAVARLIESTGSRIDDAGLRCYRTLLSSPGHIAGALGMMARWDLQPLQAGMTEFARPLTLVAGARDRAVPPDVADTVRKTIPHSHVIHLQGVGHLAHEEDPARVAEIIRQAAGV